MTRFTKEVKLLGGKNQICIVISERDPLNTLRIRKIGKRRFIQHPSRKLKAGKIDVSGRLFTGEPGVHSSIKLEISF